MTVQELKELLNDYPEDMDVMISYNDPGSDEPLVLELSTPDVNTFWDWDEDEVSKPSLIFEIG